jgi:hypothetical protein
VAPARHSRASMGLWGSEETAQRPARFLAAVEAIERWEASWHDVPTTKLLMPVDLIVRAAAATTSRAAGRHRGARRSPGRTRARSRTNRKQ